MTTFDKREKAFEAKFAQSESLRFKASARRNKLLGLWAADLMGLVGADADAYAKEVIKSDFEEVGDDDVFRKVRADLEAKNIDRSEQQIRKQMDELLSVAKAQIMGEEEE